MSLPNWISKAVPVIVAPWLLAEGWRGFALPFAVVVRERDPALIAHERCHVMQWWRGWIVGFAAAYLVELARFGYTDNKFEVEARAAERAG